MKMIQTIVLAIIIAVFILHTLSLSFTQDDAYISYRYAHNYLAGEGLVFNEAERVEGYTNFFFIILMIFLGNIGLNFILLSKIIGLVSGVGIIFILYLWSGELEAFKSFSIFRLSASFLLAINSAFAYWAISGLETVFFSFMIMLGLYLAVNRKFISVPVLALATLIRPEGGLVFIFVILFYLAGKKTDFRYIMTALFVYCSLVVPHLIFRMVYYNDILPNPFYAKTGWSMEYMSTGLSYFWAFLKHYGLYGLLLIVPVLFIRKLDKRLTLPAIISLAYIIYIIIIGGDVLYGARFFVPVLPFLYLLFSNSILKSAGYLPKLQSMVFSGTFIAIGLITFILPYSWLQTIRQNELALVESMKQQAAIINSQTHKRLTIACTTIGAFGYYGNFNLIDMLGLTDKTIAKNPQRIAGIKSSWKERNYNIRYLMQRQPDLILFSTGIKPSAPAEKALFLSSRFRSGYYPIFQEGQGLWTVFRKKGGEMGDDIYYPSAEFINQYTTALNFLNKKKYQLAEEFANRSIKNSPPDFYLPYLALGDIMIDLKNYEKAVSYFSQSLDISGNCSMLAAHRLAQFFEMVGDSATANNYYDIVFKGNRLY